MDENSLYFTATGELSAISHGTATTYRFEQDQSPSVDETIDISTVADGFQQLATGRKQSEQLVMVLSIKGDGKYEQLDFVQGATVTVVISYPPQSV